MGRFSIHFQYFSDFVGVMAGAWRTPVSGYFACGVFWDSGKRNMDLTTVFIVPNAHHILGSRLRFSEFLRQNHQKAQEGGKALVNWKEAGPKR